ncbi:hypothetical protein JYT28_00790 [Desulfobulbus sp. AH-315-M07]|nr:hypothetical protein [Desulfobulbus sp. AH-315-M07]
MAVQTSLVSAGFQLVPASQAELIGTLSVQQTEQRGFITIIRNGRRVVNYLYMVTLQLAASGRVIEVANTSFEGEQGEIDQGKINDIARALVASQRLLQYARQRTQLQQQAATAAAQRAQAAKQAQHQAAIGEARRLDEVAWVNANARACRDPQSLDACRGVRLYLANHPNAAHATEARQLLKESAPQLNELQKDENRWGKAGSATCFAEATKQACTGVEMYLMKYPAGLHSDEARRIITNAGVSQ